MHLKAALLLSLPLFGHNCSLDCHFVKAASRYHIEVVIVMAFAS